MRTSSIALAFLAVFVLVSGVSCDIGTGLGGDETGRIIDHRHASVEGLSKSEVEAAKEKLSVVYWHTSHGSQLVTGMDGMDEFFGGEGLYEYSSAPASSSSWSNRPMSAPLVTSIASRRRCAIISRPIPRRMS